MAGDRDRPLWHVTWPPGGWDPPWPQAIELVEVLPGDQWTLIGGLLVQLHMAHAGLPIVRATVDVDMVLHLETGATTFGKARAALEQLGYQLHMPFNDATPVHRFTRGIDQVDVMAADHLAPSRVPKIKGRRLFQVPAGTSALRKTVNCRIDRGEDAGVIFSIPDVLGALVLKGAAYKADTRDRGRHLDDAALLSCALESPSAEAQRLEGSDRSRIRVLANELCEPTHRSWSLVPADLRRFGIQALEVLAADPSSLPKSPRRLGD